ncbi:hypothetical protein AB0C12_01355 [Actinoplanes sp. NPDC048967]
MSDQRSGHCECQQCRRRTWAIWFMIASALLLMSAAVFIRAVLTL